MTNLPFTIAVDADGVLWEDRYPEIGAIRPETIKALRWAQKQGVVLILNTCRSLGRLIGALNAAHHADLHFDFINENDPARIEAFGGDCRKVSADLYVDDKALGWPGDDLSVARAIYAAVNAWLAARDGAAAEERDNSCQP